MSDYIDRNTAAALRLLEGMKKKAKGFDANYMSEAQLNTTQLAQADLIEAGVNRDFPSAINEARTVHLDKKGGPACGADKKFQDLVRDFETSSDASKVTCSKPKCGQKKNVSENVSTDVCANCGAKNSIKLSGPNKGFCSTVCREEGGSAMQQLQQKAQGHKLCNICNQNEATDYEKVGRKGISMPICDDCK
jgi:hypothetical protein